jgi:hypothetical protein
MSEADDARTPGPTLVVLAPVLLPLSAERERRAVDLLAELLADLLEDQDGPLTAADQAPDVAADIHGE